MFCKYCGNQLDDDAIFCSKCGKAVSDTPDAQPETFTLSVFRESQMFLLNPPINLLIDDTKRLSIENGGLLEIRLAPGSHTVEFSQGMRHKKISVLLDHDRAMTVKWNRVTGGIEVKAE